MQEFHGELLIGGMAIRNVDGLIDEQHLPSPPRIATSATSSASMTDRSAKVAATTGRVWSGEFRVDHCQHEALELGRRYLLLLDDGRNREVVLTDMHLDDQDEAAVVCEFSDCQSNQVPR